MPVSTLYIQPSGTFTLPPQTKALIAKPAAIVQDTPPTDVASDVASDEPAVATPAAPEPEQKAVAETQPPAVPPAPVGVMPVPAAEVPAVEAPVAEAPAVAAPVVEAPVAETPVVETPVVETPVVETPGAQDVAKAEPEPVVEPAPVAAPVETPKAEPAPSDAPPPPPQALTQVAPEATPTPPAATAPTATAPTPPPSGSAVVALPPRLDDNQPGVASLPSPTGPLTDGDGMRIVFEHDSSKLPGAARDALKALSERMSQQEDLRLQLLAYAGDTDTSASAARRLSLSRALAVRSFLIENGVRSTRIDVRALGNKSTEAVTERVDITVVER